MSMKPTGVVGAVFGEAADGDGRDDPRIRRALGERTGAPAEWAWARQVHGGDVVEVDSPGMVGDADALFTRTPGISLVVGTADCVPVVLEGANGVGIAHAGWPGSSLGVVANLLDRMDAAGIEVERAAIGPAIRACCFEVGPEVADLFPGALSTTAWGTVSVDLAAVVRGQLPDVDVIDVGLCTRDDRRFHSHRRDRTPERQVSMVWLPG
jgi:polyphenol oxidase